ncbi:hypothetical protein NDU88_004852 [Pleurodeles waltl]|uniref:Uncharacterized protein n=1 Tax=Pleurodeles waltl TaxID=8319 RepID=A0AAV7W8P7_PLEWA|nr:hypothetical protein NDU88_004852 [Pleurodeles waltl]
MGGPEEVREPSAPAEEPTRSELLAAIQGSRVVLEGKIEAVAVEVNLLRTDLRKVSDKVKVEERSIVDFQTEEETLLPTYAPVGDEASNNGGRELSELRILPGSSDSTRGLEGWRRPVGRSAGLLLRPSSWQSWTPAPGGGAERCRAGPMRICGLPGPGERRALTRRGARLKRRRGLSARACWKKAPRGLLFLWG